MFSYDGLAFRKHADSNYEHRQTSLANRGGSPLIVGESKTIQLSEPNLNGSDYHPDKC